jgi:hypothetical protein
LPALWLDSACNQPQQCIFTGTGFAKQANAGFADRFVSLGQKGQRRGLIFISSSLFNLMF